MVKKISEKTALAQFRTNECQALGEKLMKLHTCSTEDLLRRNRRPIKASKMFKKQEKAFLKEVDDEMSIDELSDLAF